VSVNKSLNRSLPYILLFPPVMFLISMVIYPLIYAAKLSVTNYRTGIFDNFHNFVRVLQDPLFYNSLKAIAIYIAIVITVEFFLGLFLAFIISHFIKNGWLKALFYMLFLMPIVTPPVAAGVIFRLMYTPSYGIINYLLQQFGIIKGEILWLSTPLTAMFSVISVDVWQWTPFVFFIFFAGFQAVPQDTIEAAKVDGATGWQIFRFVELPYLKPLMLLVLLFRFTDTYQVFDHVMVLTQGGPGATTQFLSVYLYKVAFKFLNLNYASAISFYVVLVALIIFVVLNRVLHREESGGEN
jgi:multiple sugar transport system permease protein